MNTYPEYLLKFVNLNASYSTHTNSNKSHISLTNNEKGRQEYFGYMDDMYQRIIYTQNGYYMDGG